MTGKGIPNCNTSQFVQFVLHFILHSSAIQQPQIITTILALRDLSLLKFSNNSSILKTCLTLHPLKPPQLGPQHPPDQPINPPQNQDRDPNDRVKPVGEACVSFSSWGTQEGGSEEETLGDEEEEWNDDPGFKGAMCLG